MGYEIVKVYYFWCDYPGCDARDEHRASNLPEALEVLTEEKRWMRFDTQLICPKHTGS